MILLYILSVAICFYGIWVVAGDGEMPILFALVFAAISLIPLFNMILVLMFSTYLINQKFNIIDKLIQPLRPRK